jgi:hypothetical protein
MRTGSNLCRSVFLGERCLKHSRHVEDPDDALHVSEHANWTDDEQDRDATEYLGTEAAKGLRLRSTF